MKFFTVIITNTLFRAEPQCFICTFYYHFHTIVYETVVFCIMPQVIQSVLEQTVFGAKP